MSPEVYLQGTPMQLETRSKLIDFMQLSLRNDELEKALVPSFSVGCRRLTPGSAYLKVISERRRIFFQIDKNK